jgi:hypothetical protein
VVRGQFGFRPSLLSVLVGPHTHVKGRTIGRSIFKIDAPGETTPPLLGLGLQPPGSSALLPLTLVSPFAWWVL